MNILQKVNSVLLGLYPGISLAVLPISVSTQLIGFLLPANWFSLKASRKYYKAEKKVYQNLMLE